MNEFETLIELCGSEYAARVHYEYDEEIIINAVCISREIRSFYNAAGEYAPKTEKVSVDITAMLDDNQLCALADEIIADAACRRFEAEGEAAYWRKAA